ncbi:GUN4 domain-containing protein [Aphanothece sacrum]|uniref:GUN4 domain protein n=1 Tax=Aphanothece sacrum FPU1 TaxID=1920663 RepID=A0A401IDY7_APHSA|nr:GUN4 domain-containing protein [Aphanothece sacrum]GBF79461.1 GUN4 domain protein [Aphanothece sacrum FPU1]GBF85809.1 GUN4 domain protein [Aphanothece sacrum FPU3]
MSEPLPEIDNNTQWTEILGQLQSLNNRVTYLEEKLKLVSDLDRYGKLQSLLMAGKFKEADLETTVVILDAVNKSRDDLTPDDMTKFPCNILKVIDRLWQDYSDNRFGFSKQLTIYQEVGGSLDTLRAQNTQVLEKYGDQVGWRKEGKWQGNNYDNWDFSLSAPVGCFPAIWWKSPYGFKMATFCFIRLINCDIS